MRLPVSGLDVRFHSPDGNDDLAILEAEGNSVERSLAVLSRLSQSEEPAGRNAGGERDAAFWEELSVTDFEAALLGLRRFLLGDAVTCLYRDPGHACEVRMEVEFSIAALLGRAKPRVPRGVHAIGGESGWFAMEENKVRFRLPTVADQLDVMNEPRASELLMRRCCNGAEGGGRATSRIERAMEALAPPISQPLEGRCPECGGTVNIPLHVPQLVMEELRDGAAGVYEEIDRIAAAYHWEEAAILAMPRSRRRAYAETIERRMRSTA